MDQKKVRELRRAKGLSKRALAEAAGVSTETIHAIEHGTHTVTVATLEKVARALGVQPRDLF